jgi:tetratricopeptide (TPR) repeat protein
MSTAAQTARGERVGRAGRTPGQLWQVPVFVVGVIALLAVAGRVSFRYVPQDWEFDEAIASLRRGLEQGSDAATLVAQAERALTRLPQFPDRTAEVHFLAGSAYYRRALAQPPAQARATWPLVTDHLSKSFAAGPDEADLPRLQYRLGWALYQQGQDVPRALELMAGNIDHGADQPAAGYHLLARAYLALPTPDVAAALAASEKLLELTDDRDPDALARARLLHAELLIRSERRADAVRELQRIDKTASRPVRVKARLLQVQTCEADGLWHKAIPLWRELLADAEQVLGGAAHVQYALGNCLEKTEPPDEAGAIVAWTAAARLAGDDGQAAGLRLGRLLLFGSAPKPGEALTSWRQALDPVHGPDDYKNAVFSQAKVRVLFEHALLRFQETEDFERARQVAELYRKVASASAAEEKLAQALEAGAKKLRGKTGAKAEDVEGRFRRAAEAYERAAAGRPAGERADPLWNGATCFLAARDGDKAARLLQRLDKLEPKDDRLAEGWYSLGRLYQQGKKVDRAREAYLRSMEFAQTAFAAKSRYMLAREETNKQNWKRAEEILQQNLNLGPALDREAHEKSLYWIGWVLFQARDYGRAEFFLKQAAGRYPNNPNALVWRELLGDCYRRLAKEAELKEQDQAKALPPDLPAANRAQIEETMRHHCQTRKKFLGDSTAVYQALADELKERERKRPLNAKEASLLRRALLGQAENHADLTEFRDALKLYQDLLHRHRRQVEALIAVNGIYRLVGLATDPDQKTEMAAAAREAVALAREDLQKMNPKDDAFRGPDVWSWEHWQRELQAMQTALTVPPGSSRPTSLGP